MATGSRTILATPMVREGVSIGVIMIRRTEVSPLLGKTDQAARKPSPTQAVIAIEKSACSRSYPRSVNRGIARGAEHQTATGEVLGIIAARRRTCSRSGCRGKRGSGCATDDVELRLHEGDVMVARAHFGPIPIGRAEISVDEPQKLDSRSTARFIFSPSWQNEYPIRVGVPPAIAKLYLAIPLRGQTQPIGYDKRSSQRSPPLHGAD